MPATIASHCSIDATGRASVFARRIGALRHSLDRLTGVAGYFAPGETAAELEPVLLVEAVENGWWYSAPLPNGKLIAVFMTDAGLIRSDKLSSTAVWMDRLADSVHHRRRVAHHGGRLTGALRILPAESSFLNRVAGVDWIAAGDAAAAFDPLSSQGILTAISSGMDAARTAVAWLSGDRSAPAAYAERVWNSYATYLAHRHAYYRMEQRWPNSQFWASRQVLPAALPSREGRSAAK